MKRRGFLQMLGSALAAPLMPQASLGAATKVAYPASAFHAAIYHAQTRVNFSVFALASRLGIDLDQAEAVMRDMSARGILGPLQGTSQAGTWARSTIWQRPAHAIATGKVAKTVAPAQAPARTPVQTPATPREMPAALKSDPVPLLADQDDVCRFCGRTLNPRCEEEI